MSTAEYLVFIPLLIYGVGLTTLLVEWKRLFDPSEFFLPYTLLTLVMTEIAIYNVFIYQRLINQFSGQSYLTYLTFLISPFLFFLVTNIFTPEPGEKTREHFIKRMPLFYSLFALLVASNFIYRLEASIYANVTRIVFILVLLSTGFTRKIWLTYVVVILWLISFFIRGSIISG
jgi:hypothetical protein